VTYEDRTTDDEIVEFLSSRMPKAVSEEKFSGVVLFARGDEVLYHEAFGLASRRHGVANRIDTRLNLASSSKMFTSVVIGQLVESGELSFDDAIGEYVGSDWISPEVGKKVRISHLLCHTSGLGMFWDGWESHALTVRSISDFRPLFSDKLAFEPGEKHEYSNSGYLLLGLVIEKVVARDYYEVIGERIFEQCGMRDSGFFEMDIPHENLATGYFEDEDDGGRLKDNTLFQGLRGSPAGGGWSTTADLHRFFRSLSDGALVGAEMLETLCTPKPPSTDYGYGFQSEDGWIGHWGGFPGVESFPMYFPKSERTLVVLSNYYDGALPLIKDLSKRFGDIAEALPS
jgi:CubicO group peptidase (beta-lactamase class C family)